MARIRTIKPEFWEDEKVGRLPISCRLFFIGCWNFADDFGCIKGNAALLKSQIFPYDENLRVSEVKKWIDALVDARMLIPIIHAEESYYYIRTFRSHQVIDKRYDKSFIGKEIINDLINKALREHNINTTSTHSEHHVNTMEEMEKEEEMEEKRDTDVSPESPDPINSDFPKEETHPPVAPPPLPNPDFEKFQKWILEKAPRVAKMEEPFTEEEYLRIKEEFPPGMTAEVLLAMHNSKDLLKKNLSANLTFRNWIKRRQNDGKNANNRKPDKASDEEFARGLAATALRLEYESLDKGHITPDEFKRRTGIEPLPRQARNY
jgi:hypothetical protein